MKNILVFIFTAYQIISCILLIFCITIFAADMMIGNTIFRKDIQFDVHKVTITLLILVVPNAFYGFWKGMRRIKENL